MAGATRIGPRIAGRSRKAGGQLIGACRAVRTLAISATELGAGLYQRVHKRKASYAALRFPEAENRRPLVAYAHRVRADARRNRERVVRAARDVFVDLGSDAPLDEVARRAGVGIATLYRGFPERAALQRAVALDVLREIGDHARLVLGEEHAPFDALARYMHQALIARVGAVLPALVGALQPWDAELEAARAATAASIEQLIDRAHADASLRSDVTFADIGTLLVTAEPSLAERPAERRRGGAGAPPPGYRPGRPAAAPR